MFYQPVAHGQARSPVEFPHMVCRQPNANSVAGEGYSVIPVGRSIRVSLMLVPQGRGAFAQQLREVLNLQDQLLAAQEQSMTVTSQTVFLRDAETLGECAQILQHRHGDKQPVTNIVFQPPCCGAALALEAWAIGGRDVRIEHRGAHTITVSYDDTRWVYCAGLRSDAAQGAIYAQTTGVLERMQSELQQAGSGFEHVLRTWFYLGGITESEAGLQRYMELNRARTDFYRPIKFHCSVAQPSIPQGIYPASTGIGMKGPGLAAGCLALQTPRTDAFLLPLENPQQTPAYAYHPRHSPQSPKFSRGVALVLDDYITTWVSGTASVVHSLSRHPGDIRRQTEQTIENIEKLISADNFVFHGIKHPGAGLSDLAKVRIYLKRPQDFALCKSICDERFGSVPAIYALADVCRPELLVEIEGVAFTKRTPPNHAAVNDANHAKSLSR